MSKLKEELANLNKNIIETDNYLGALAHEFWRNGGICCPTCGVEGYGELELKQERRWKRIEEVEAKLAKIFG